MFTFGGGQIRFGCPCRAYIVVLCFHRCLTQRPTLS